MPKKREKSRKAGKGAWRLNGKKAGRGGRLRMNENTRLR